MTRLGEARKLRTLILRNKKIKVSLVYLDRPLDQLILTPWLNISSFLAPQGQGDSQPVQEQKAVTRH
jgi:hypothetical protein